MWTCGRRPGMIPWSSAWRSFATHAAHKSHADGVRVIYRGGSYMRKPYFYIAGACFVLAGLNFGLFIRDFLVWPLLPSDDTQPELARPGIRYSLAGGTVLIASLCGWYFWYAPSRMVTRLTVYPAKQMLGVRTAAPAPSRYLPCSLRNRPFFERAGLPSLTDRCERLVPLEAVYRLQGSAEGSEMQVWSELIKTKKELVSPATRAHLIRYQATSSKYDQQDTLMLRVGDARLAFQLSANPEASSLVHEPPKRGLRSLWRRVIRGTTDWGVPPNYVASPQERVAREHRLSLPYTDTEPWFLDRIKFDQLFPLDASRYKKSP